MKPRRALLLCLAAIASGITACGPQEEDVANGDDPLQALTVGAVSQRYDDAFWGQQRHEDPDLWARAKTYCEDKDVGAHPNCRPVLGLMGLERTLERPRSSSPGLEGSLDLGERQGEAQRRLDSLRQPE